jgi:hypothetical protein
MEKEDSMKADDPRLEASLKAMTERVTKMDALTLAVLRGHLLLEQTMDEFLTASLFHCEHVLESRYSFLHKAQLCKAMSLNQNGNPIWELVWRGNELRNKIAHTLSTAEIKKKMDSLRAGYMDVLTPEQGKGQEKQTDDRIAEAAFLLAAGFLAAMLDDAKSRRAVIDKQWKPKQ